MEDFQNEIDRILAKKQISQADLEFLKARRDYLSEEDKKRLFAEEKAPKKAKKKVKKSKSRR